MRSFIIILILFLNNFSGYSQKYLLEQDVNQDTIIPDFGFQRKYDGAFYIAYGFMNGPNINRPPSGIKYWLSGQIKEGFWLRRKITESYSLGVFLEYSRDNYRLNKPIIGDSFDRANTTLVRQINNNLSVGVFNRFLIKSRRLFFDAGVYYSFDMLPKIQNIIKPNDAEYTQKKVSYTKPSIMNRHNVGLDFKLTYNILSFYSRFRITSLYKKEKYDLPKWVLGISFDIKE